MMKINEVLKKQIESISLSRDEITHLKKKALDFVSILEKKGMIAFIGGSLAKGTLVRKEGRQDVDIFVVFDDKNNIKRLELFLKKTKLPGKLNVVHGSRDYFSVDCDDVVLEIIPVLENTNPHLAENVTDFSLSHVKYIAGEIKKKPGIADEIRLAKAFCMAQNCYGAESYIKGFSGYSLEVFVIYFGSFVNFLKGISKKRVFDPKKFFKNDKEVLSEINSSKLIGPIVLVDPTYKYRNVCAGLGAETFEKFLNVSKEFLKKPSQDFFKRKKIDILELKKIAKKKKAKFVEIDLRTDRQEGSVAGSKMKKFLDFFVRELERKQQKVLLKEFDYLGNGNKAKGYILVLKKEEVDVRGPSIGLEDAVDNFKKYKGNKAFRKGKYWWFKERVTIEEVFNHVKKVEKEMGAGGRIVSLI